MPVPIVPVVAGLLIALSAPLSLMSSSLSAPTAPDPESADLTTPHQASRPRSSPTIDPLPAVPTPRAAAHTRSQMITWVAPIQNYLIITRGFDPPAATWLPGHRGVDLAAAIGTPVVAAGSGVITWASVIAGRGVVVVLHPDGRRTTYEPLTPEVAVGEVVIPGQVLGTISSGTGHCGRGPGCLHWGLRLGQEYLDPMSLLRPGDPELLPLTG